MSRSKHALSVRRCTCPSWSPRSTPASFAQLLVRDGGWGGGYHDFDLGARGLVGCCSPNGEEPHVLGPSVYMKSYQFQARIPFVGLYLSVARSKRGCMRGGVGLGGR
jgi:hypothetical protein